MADILGPELLINGDFEDGLNNWSAAAVDESFIVLNTTDAQAGSNSCELYADPSGDTCYILQGGVCEVGKTYRITIWSKRLDEKAGHWYISQPFSTPNQTAQPDWFEQTFEQEATATNFVLSRSVTDTHWLIDSISVREVIPYNPGTVVNARITRNEPGSGPCLISSGFPVPEGLVSEDMVRSGKIIVRIDDVEQTCNITGLRGRHNDGTLRSVLIQLTVDMAQGETLDATVEFDSEAERANPDPDYVLPTWAMFQNNNNILPTDSTYLCTTQIALRKFSPVGTGTAEDIKLYDTYLDDRFNYLEGLGDDPVAWSGSASYEAPIGMLAAWCRTGDSKYFDQALFNIKVKRLGYYTPEDPEPSPACKCVPIVNPDGRVHDNAQKCGVPAQWHSPMTLSFAAAYLMTGFRDLWSTVAYMSSYQTDEWNDPAYNPIGDSEGYDLPRNGYGGPNAGVAHGFAAHLIDATLPVDGQYYTAPTLDWATVLDKIRAWETNSKWDMEWVPFSNGFGSVPERTGTISQGGVSAEFHGIYERRGDWIDPDDGNAVHAQLLPGSEMITDGFIQIWNRTGGSFSAGGLTFSEGDVVADCTGPEEGDYRNGQCGTMSDSTRHRDGSIPNFQLEFPINLLIDIYMYFQKDDSFPAMVKGCLDSLLMNISDLVPGDTYYGYGDATWGDCTHGHPYRQENPVFDDRGDIWTFSMFARAIPFVKNLIGDDTINGKTYDEWYSILVNTGQISPLSGVSSGGSWKTWGQYFGWGQDTIWLKEQADLAALAPATTRAPTVYDAIPNETPDLARGDDPGPGPGPDPGGEVTFDESGTPDAVVATGQREITLGKPASVVEGTGMLAIISSDVETGSRFVETIPAGWTEVRGGAGALLHVFKKVAGASEPADYTFGFSANYNEGVGAIIPYFGGDFDDITFVGIHTDGTSNTTLELPDVTVAGDGYGVLWIGTLNATAPKDCTACSRPTAVKRISIDGVSNMSNCLWVWAEDNVAAGGYTGESLTMTSSGAQRGAAIVIASSGPPQPEPGIIVVNEPASNPWTQEETLDFDVDFNGDGGYGFVDFDNSLEVWWRFTPENPLVAADYGNKNHPGDITGTISDTGPFGPCLDTIDAQDCQAQWGKRYFTVPRETSLTISTWVKTSHTAGAQHLMDLGLSGNNSVTFYIHVGGQLWVVLQDERHDVQYANSVSAFPRDGTWHHAALVLTGTNPVNAKFYIDGVLDATVELTGYQFPTMVYKNIATAGFTELIGSAAEVLLFTRELSDAEIAALAGNHAGNLSFSVPVTQLQHPSYKVHYVENDGRMHSTVEQQLLVDSPTSVPGIIPKRPTDGTATKTHAVTFDVTAFSTVMGYSMLDCDIDWVGASSSDSIHIPLTGNVEHIVHTANIPMNETSIDWSITVRDEFGNETTSAVMTVQVGGQTSFHVSTGGDDDTGDGTAENPWKTIQKFADVSKPGDTCYIHAGTYREVVTFSNSGTRQEPITIKPAPGEEVIIHGGELVTGWTNVSGNIYKAPLPSNLGRGFNQILVDGEGWTVTEARWPACATYLDHDLGTFDIEDGSSYDVDSMDIINKPSGGVDGHWVGATVHAIWQPRYHACTGLVTSSTEATGLIQATFDKNGAGYGTMTNYGVFALLGTPACITQAGQWAVDHATDEVHLWAPGDVDPSTLVVEAKQRIVGFNIVGSNIRVEGLKFRSCTITFNTFSSECVLDDVEVLYPSYKSILDQGDMSGAGDGDINSGVVLDGIKNQILDSTIRFSTGNCISLIGESNQVRRCRLSHANTMVSECSVVSFGRSGATECIISASTMEYSGRAVVNFAQAIGCEISDCHIGYDNWQLYAWDSGQIYTIDTESYARISRNQFYGLQSNYGIYLDGWSSHADIDNNVIERRVDGDESWDGGILANNAHTEVRIQHNTCERSIIVSRNSIYVAENDAVQNNICSEIVLMEDGTPGASWDDSIGILSNNIEYNSLTPQEQADLYTDEAGGDLTLGPNSVAIDYGVDLQFVHDVIRDPRNVGASPDAGAYERQS